MLDAPDDPTKLVEPVTAEVEREVRARLKKRGISLSIVDEDIGYELRCAPPIPFDQEYTRELGYGVVKFLAHGGSGASREQALEFYVNEYRKAISSNLDGVVGPVVKPQD